MNPAGRILFYVMCAAALSACGGGSGSDKSSGNGDSNGSGNGNPSYSISASQSAVTLHYLTNGLPPYRLPNQSVTLTYTGATIELTNSPSWLIVSSPPERSSPLTFDITPQLSAEAGDYATTLHFVTAAADGSNAVSAEVMVSLQVEAGSAIHILPEGLATGSTISASVNDGSSKVIGPSGSLGLVAAGDTFTTTVTEQPSNQRCTFANGEPTASHVADSSSLTLLKVYCNATLMPWTWIGGSQATAATPVHGTRGAPSTGATPGAREAGAYVADSGGNLWLFGGTTDEEFRNDLWRYDTDAATWTWISGSSATDAAGVYGTRSIPDSSNAPGARTGAVAWIDGNGDFWLFGGHGYGAAAGEQIYLNDVWKYDVDTDTWTWMGGNDGTTFLATGTYGTTPSPDNIPGGRINAGIVQDGHGAVWIFGGYGQGAAPVVPEHLNDLWRFTLANGEWEWMSGADRPVSAPVYGAQGVPDAANHPGGRAGSAMWTDASGHVWIFGGAVWGERRGDLWRYDPGANMWTWMHGSNELGLAAGQYSPPGTSNSDMPSGRYGAAAWSDVAGNFWLFGGDVLGLSNDLWRYTPATNTWSWLSGGWNSNAPAIYGTQGVASQTNVPSARRFPAAWRDSSGRLWLYGGLGNQGEFVDDLWRVETQ